MPDSSVGRSVRPGRNHEIGELMGYIRHHAIVVSGMHKWNIDGDLPDVHEARQAAIDAGCAVVTEVAGPGVNGTASFLVGPDGSKEGWGSSDEGDEARTRFIAWLRDRGKGGYYDWAEVVLGSDDAEALIERHAWDSEMDRR